MYTHLSNRQNNVVTNEPAEDMDKKEDQTVPAEQVVDGPGRTQTEHETLLHWLEPGSRCELEAELAPADHTLLPGRNRVVGVVL